MHLDIMISSGQKYDMLCSWPNNTYINITIIIKRVIKIIHTLLIVQHSDQ